MPSQRLTRLANIQSLEVFRYEIPLMSSVALNISGKLKHLNTREGLLFKWKFKHQDSTQVIYSEAAPLPGFSSESLDEIIHLIKKQTLTELIHSSTGNSPTLYPALNFAVESAFYILEHGIQLSNLETITTDTCGLLDTVNISLNTLDKPCYKIKVGRTTVDEDIHTVKQFTQQLSAGQKLRLDSNKSWSFTEFEKLLKNIDLTKIEFIEEPLTKYSDYQKLAPFPVGIALDESLREKTIDLATLLKTTNLSHIIIKPMISGLTEALRLITIAKEKCLTPILSGAYESNISICFYYHLIRTEGIDGIHGLDTLKSLKHNLVFTPNKIRGQDNAVILEPISTKQLQCFVKLD